MERPSGKLFLTAFLFLLMENNSCPQQDIIQVSIPITLTEYLSNVAKGNLGYTAGRYNVSIAEAGLKAAKVFPDPEIAVVYTNNEDQTLQMGQSIETALSYPVNMGNKRGAAIAVARSQFELAEAMLEAHFQHLKADATKYFFAAMKEQQIYQLHVDTYQSLKRLAEADSIRFAKGEITEIDALQSALEAKTQLNQVSQSGAEMHNMLINLSLLQGKALPDTLYIPSGQFLQLQKTYNLSELIQVALHNRADMQVAIKSKNVSDKTVRLKRANRAFEFSLEAGYAHNSIVENEIAPAPAHNSYSGGLSIPLKFSSLNKGDLQAARFAAGQYEIASREAELQITAEVVQAYHIFKAREKQLDHYRQGWVENAEKILKGRIYLYQRGECGLLDVLNAQRTYYDLRKEYYDTLYEFTAAWIELERAAALY
jgi:cobalt-zinc-cadmium efflux system outer membrane protein